MHDSPTPQPDCITQCSIAANQLWAKSAPYKQLLSHMLDTGCCAVQFLKANSSRAILNFLMQQLSYTDDEVCSFVGYLATMHDIGKAMPWFQRNNEEQFARLKNQGLAYLFPAKYLNPIQHEYISARVFSRVWKKRKEQKRLCDSYAAILFLHHQRRNSFPAERIPEEWAAIQDELEVLVSHAFPVKEHLPKPQNMDATGILLSGLIILCDWVASSGPFDNTPTVGENYLAKAMNKAHETLQCYGLIGDRVSPKVGPFRSLWPHITTPRDIQKRCEGLSFSSPITIIEAPMGEGKTEAALYLAERMCSVWNKRGIYVALPTQATSNQMYGRTKAMLDSIEGGHTRLLHGTAFLQQEERHVQSDDQLEAERWLGPLRMGMLDENGVGTVDQAMAGVLKARFSVLRLLGLTNKVLIVDELHAYDAYMSEIIQSLLRWCKDLQIPVVLLSATLQNQQRKAYLSCYTNDECLVGLSESYPLITQVDEDGHIIQTEASATMETVYDFLPVCFENSDTALAQYALDQIQNGGCYCILANTVKKAQSIYRALLEIKDQETQTLLFHARFTIKKRAEIEKTCLQRFGQGHESNRPFKAILVATQVVEQSLDLDFDGMLTELAPIDLLLQRAGRVHRHRSRIRPKGMEKPVIHVILPDQSADPDLEKRYGINSYVYAPLLLNNTENMLKAGKSIRVPRDVRNVIEKVYANVTQENMKVWQEREFAQQLMRANADGVCFPDPNEASFFPAQSHPEFSSMEIDDGFEPASHAATRLGDPTFRIAFVTAALKEAAQNGKLKKAQQNEVFMSSVSLSMSRVSNEDLADSCLYRIEKGVLKGCYILDNCDKISIGKKFLVNDPILGIYWKE